MIVRVSMTRGQPPLAFHGTMVNIVLLKEEARIVQEGPSAPNETEQIENNDLLV